MNVNVKIAFLVLGAAVFAGALVLLAWKLEDDASVRQTVADKRIGEDVVATYVGGEITAQELRAYINKMTAGEGRHEICVKHGTDHGKCDPSEQCETHPLESAESYRMFLRELVMERMVDEAFKVDPLNARIALTIGEKKHNVKLDDGHGH